MAERMRSTETLLALLDAFGSSLDVIFPKKHFLAGISSGGSEPMLDETQVGPSIHPTTIFGVYLTFKGRSALVYSNFKNLFPCNLDESANIGIRRV